MMLIGFLYGNLTMYFLGGMLHMHMLESSDPDQPNNHIKFALMWPLAAFAAIYETILESFQQGGDKDE